jgi:hypothetical protein
VQREIIQLTVDLLNPLNTTVTIGAYIPNIIYINKETAEKASGGGGGGGGGRGQTDKEKEFSEFQTQISANQYQILLRAWQQNINNEILKQAGVQLDADGVLMYALGENTIGGKIQVQRERIDLVVEGEGAGAEIKAASIVLAINDDGGSTIKLSADTIDIDGVVAALVAKYVETAGLMATTIEATEKLIVDTVDVGAAISDLEDTCSILNGVSWHSATVVTGISRTASHTFTAKNGSDYTGALVTGVSTATISYLGA